ncbi:hypothetical protein CKO25_11070 [Thiocapsa imhoffii]|uniref:Uncharacterized protein n=2 Tax=Thiocapsa imhoffii TaxID=382777 RepID=A0A9X0WI55_9GAMM|nr:hypothetical protein [Thiocapsa imhoffii]
MGRGLETIQKTPDEGTGLHPHAETFLSSFYSQGFLHAPRESYSNTINLAFSPNTPITWAAKFDCIALPQTWKRQYRSSSSTLFTPQALPAQDQTAEQHRTQANTATRIENKAATYCCCYSQVY